MHRYVDVGNLASLAEVSRQAIEKALKRIISGQVEKWRGARLSIRTVRGRGGRSGHRYEVLVSSLPLDLQWRLKAAEKAALGSLTPAEEGAAERAWWMDTLGPALAQLKHSRERGAEIKAIVSRPLTDWNGKPFQPSERMIQRQIEAYELHGYAGLGKFQRKDKGVKKVLISKRWDEAVTLDEDARERIAGELKGYIRGLYKKDVSAKLIHALAADKLAKLTAKEDRRSLSDELKELCQVPRTFVEEEKQYRKVAILNKDRKTHEDARPRISRTRAGLAPMDIVYGDVHHIDIVMRREDGSEAWPKAIAWLDAATNRLRFDLMLLEKGEGIRNADVIRSFVRMTQDAAWGLPRHLYLDNGSEYRWADFVDDAMKLVAHVDITGGGSAGSDASRITRARPYNAQAKPIEGVFGRLEQNYFRHIQGWVGGDRTNKKTANVGKPPEPFEGSLDDLRAVLEAHLGLWEALPQKGALKGLSPRKVYENALNDGWQRIAVDPHELRTVFATHKTREVRSGTISFDGRKWTCDALISYLGRKVTVLAPKFETPVELPVLDDKGELLGFAVPERDYDLLDRDGARESSRRDRLHKATIRKLDRAAPEVDPTAEVLRYAQALPSPTPAPIAGIVSVSPLAQAIAREIEEAPEDRQEKKRRAAQKAGKEREAILQNALKRISGGAA